jgi:thiazole synthase
VDWRPRVLECSKESAAVPDPRPKGQTLGTDPRPKDTKESAAVPDPRPKGQTLDQALFRPPIFRPSRRSSTTLPPPSIVGTRMSVRPLVIAGRKFSSRLFVGTGKFPSPEVMRAALAASGTEMVTVALRRADLTGQGDPFANILEFIDPQRYLVLPNTSGAMNAEEAVRLARLAVAAGLPKWVKLEIHPDPRYLLPDPIETLRATEQLAKEGFVVLPYMNADPVLAKRLQEAGAATVMPLGSPIGSHRGLQTRDQIRIILEQATVPVVVDAGIGAPSHAAEAMELGADAVLVNTAIAVPSDPPRMAEAFRQAVEAGRTAYELGLGAPLDLASPTSPLTGFLS